ncbi:hypothetical protein OKW32_000594 [Paraburkholderia youngii]
MQQRKREPLLSECDTGRVRDGAIRATQFPYPTEVVHVIVERQAGGFAVPVRYWDQQFEFQLLRALTVRDDLAAAAKKWVVRDVEFSGQA